MADLVPITNLRPSPWNPRILTKERFDNLCASIKERPEFVEDREILARILPDGTGEIYGGNQRYRALCRLYEEGWQSPWGHGLVPATLRVVSEQEAKARALIDNNEWGEEDRDLTAELIYSLGNEGVDLSVLGYPDDQLRELLDSVGALGETDGEGGDGAGANVERASLFDRFGVPPFSVLDARQGYWQARKRQWLSLGIKSELGRGENIGAIPPNEAELRSASYRDKGNGLLGESEQARSHYRAGSEGNGPARTSGQDLMRGEHTVGKGQPPNATVKGRAMQQASLGKDGKTVRGDGRGRAFNDHDWPANHGQSHPQAGLTWHGGHSEASLKVLEAQPQSGTSIFDPVLCELAYRWFSPPDGAILDPFAGGSVRGIVASVLGRSYTGIDLSERQIEANREQGASITPQRQPEWHVGDSLRVGELAPGAYDLLFSCPPYADLERYSDDQRDLSTMNYADFLAVYGRIIAACASLLKPDRFACFVVGDVRDPKGLYRNFVSDTIRCFQDAGLRLYNEAILVTAVGSLPIRVGKQFSSSRKLGKTHQNVLVFCNGDPRKATEACGPVEVVDLDELLADGLSDG